MIRALFSYGRNEVRPRIVGLVFGSQLVLAAGGAASFGVWGGDTGVASSTLGDVATALLAYGAIAFGFSLTGLTVGLTLPSTSFTRKLAVAQLDRSKIPRWRRWLARRDANGYSDLLFVFSWSCIVHWTLIAVVFGLLVALGTDAHVFPQDPSSAARVRAGLLAFLLLYAMFQFLVVLITVSQLGRTLIAHLRKEVLEAEDTVQNKPGGDAS